MICSCRTSCNSLVNYAHPFVMHIINVGSTSTAVQVTRALVKRAGHWKATALTFSSVRIRGICHMQHSCCSSKGHSSPAVAPFISCSTCQISALLGVFAFFRTAKQSDKRGSDTRLGSSTALCFREETSPGAG